MSDRGTTISIDPDEGEFDPPLAFEKGGALWALAEIRQRTGVGMAPMLSELPDAVMAEIAGLRARVETLEGEKTAAVDAEREAFRLIALNIEVELTCPSVAIAIAAAIAARRQGVRR